MSEINFDRFFRTEKQKVFKTNFFTDADNYEVWDEVDFNNLKEIDGENSYEIKAEDLKYYAEGCLDDNPLMNDEEYAKKTPHKGLVPHPIFVTPLLFWCIGEKGKGNWLRTPGARNPGQDLTIYENFRVGEVIHIKVRPYDRYIKRGKYYLRYKIDFFNQENVKKCTFINTLILPRTKQDIAKFLKGQRGLTD